MIEILVIWIGIAALGALPSLIAMHIFEPKIALAVLALSVLLPFGFAQLELINPAFGGSIVLAIPFWGGCAVALLLLSNAVPTGWLSRQDEGN